MDYQLLGESTYTGVSHLMIVASLQLLLFSFAQGVLALLNTSFDACLCVWREKGGEGKFFWVESIVDFK